MRLDQRQPLGTMGKAEQRQHRILDLVAEHNQVFVNDLADGLGVSKETIRRDLFQLEDKGLLRKVHGGAVRAQTATKAEFETRLTEQAHEKQIIAEQAAALFQQGDSLMLFSGTTTMALANVLAMRDGMTVVTNSVEVAAIIWRGPGRNQVFLLGGEYHGDDFETIGPLTAEQIASYHVDHAVLTVTGIDAKKGLTNFNVETASLARATMRQATSTTVLADSHKMGRTALAKVCDLAMIDRIVTDREPSAEIRGAIEAADVELIVVGTGGANND